MTSTEIVLPLGFAGVRREATTGNTSAVRKLLRSKKKEIKVIIVSGEKRRALFSPRIFKVASTQTVPASFDHVNFPDGKTSKNSLAAKQGSC